jgi:signal transduction histidine kinase
MIFSNFFYKIFGKLKLLNDLKESNKQLLKSNEKLKEVNYELENFAMVAAHDIQDPLKQNKMFFKLMQSGKTEFLEDAIKNNDRMIDFVKNLLDFARSVELKITEVNLKTVAYQALNNLTTKISEISPDIEIKNLPTINCDPIQFCRVFQNLISNSIKCRSNERKLIIAISCKKIDDNWEITVEDNGKGIDEEQMKHLFTIYRGKKNDSTGAGFGLAICKKIVEAHKGTIKAETKLGLGTKFTITIPEMQL